MSDLSKCKTIYISRELREAKAATTGGEETISFPETKTPALLRVVRSHHCSLGIRRSFASTDLQNLHPNSTHNALSLDSLEGALLLRSDSEQRRVELQPTSDTKLKPKSGGRNGRLSPEDMVLSAGGEGKCDDEEKKKSAGTEYEEWWETSEPGQEDSGSFYSVDEEEEGWSAKPKEATVRKRPDVAGTSTERCRKYLQDFCSLPKRLVPSEITHCLYELEEECRGVQRASESVMWKMELIHRSVQALQETLRTLLIHLVAAQSSQSDGVLSPSSSSASHARSLHRPGAPLCPAPAPSETLSVHSDASEVSQATSDSSWCSPAHSGAVRCPPETCLTDETGHCCQWAAGCGAADPPSSAEHREEKAADFHAVAELRTEVVRLRRSCQEEHREHQEALGALRGFQRDMEAQLSQWQREREEQGAVSEQLGLLRQQADAIAEMTRHAVSVFCRVGLQLEGLGTVGTLVQSASSKLIPPSDSSLRCQNCSSKAENSNRETEE